MAPPSIPGLVKFGMFEVDLRSHELRKNGGRVRLQDQPFQVLAQLLEHPGELVTREDLHQKLWPADTFVDFENGLNVAVGRLREALGDSAENPRFIETLPRRGYRFIAPTDGARAESTEAIATPGAPTGKMRRALSLGGIALTVLLVLLAGFNPGQLRQRLFAGGRPMRIRSIAVLPLENLSGDPAQDYFADGMTDALTTDLAQIGSLRVVSRTSAMLYKGQKKPLQQIARELNVDAVVEGSVVRSGNRVRITAQLIRVATDEHMWAANYERDLRDILTVQGEVAHAVAEKIEIQLTPQGRAQLARSHPVNTQAYESYLQGRFYWNQRTPEGLQKALEYFERAKEQDPNSALAYAGLADTYSMLASYGQLAPRKAFPRGEAAAKRALELDEGLAEAHASLAYARHHFDWDWAGAEKEYQRALELNPGYATGHQWYAEYLSTAGRHQEAISEIRRAYDLDPLSIAVRSNLGRMLYFAHQYDQAIQELSAFLEQYPNSPWSRDLLGITYDQKGNYPQAILEIRKAMALWGGAPGTSLAHVFARSGRTSEARKILTDLEGGMGEDSIDRYFIAGVYAALGEKDHAFAWLERSYREHGFFLVFTKENPWLDPLRTDPRFQDLLRRIGLQS